MDRGSEGVIESRRIGRRAVLAGLCVMGAPSIALAKKRPVWRYDVKVPGSSIDAGAARCSVRAPKELVDEVVNDFGHYSKYIEKVTNSRVVSRGKAHQDMYFEIPILHGLTKVWAVVRFTTPIKEGGAQVLRGRMMKGNAKRLDITWRLRPLESGQTELTAELLLDMKLPAPDSMVLKTVRRAAHRAVTGVRDEAERRRAARG